MRHPSLCWSLLVALTASIAFVPGTATADDPPPPPYPSNAAPVYLIVSFDDEFIVGGEGDEGGEGDQSPSRTILVNIGTFTGGGGILDTRFAANQALTQITLPAGDGNPTFADFQDNASTVLGSFSTTDFDEVHMVTPSADGVAPAIQAAVFAASSMGLLDELIANADNPFPTTTQIATVIAEQLSGYPESEYGVADVEAAVFGAVVPLAPADAGLSAAGEGEMFPHSSGAASLFRYNVKFDSDGDFESDVCLLVGIDIKPGSDTNPINIKKKGQLPVAILTTDSFDAQDVDGSTATIGGVLADKWAIEDVDDDGDDDMILHWGVPDLVDAGVIVASTTQLTVRADLEDGSCITGTDNVTIKTK